MGFAVPVGFIATRFKHHHFLLVTIVISVLVTTTLSSGHWKWIGGPYVSRTLPFTPELSLGLTTLSFFSGSVTYYFTLIMSLLTFLLTWKLVTSPFGYALRAVKDNERRASLIGLNIYRLRWAMFVFAAGIAGVSGSLYTLLARHTSLEFYGWTYSGMAVVMAVVGGVNSLIGPFLGTAFYMVAKEYLSRYFKEFIIAFAILMFIVIRYAPDGMWGIIDRLYKRISKS